MKRGTIALRNFIKLTLIVLACAVLFSVNANAAKLSKKSLTIEKGKTYTLKIKGAKKKAVWKTKNKKVAKLASKKKSSVKIKAVKAGKTTVTAKVGKKTYQCRVTVVDTSKKDTSETEEKNIDEDNQTTAEQPADKVPDKTTTEQTAVKRVWIVTEWGYTEYSTGYVNKRSQWECTCGYKSENLDEFGEHEGNHLSKGEPSAWRVNTIWDSTYDIVTIYPDKGYWIEIGINEYPEGLRWMGEESVQSIRLKDITTGEEYQPTTGYYYIDKTSN